MMKRKISISVGIRTRETPPSTSMKSPRRSSRSSASKPLVLGKIAEIQSNKLSNLSMRKLSMGKKPKESGHSDISGSPLWKARDTYALSSGSTRMDLRLRHLRSLTKLSERRLLSCCVTTLRDICI